MLIFFVQNKLRLHVHAVRLAQRVQTALIARADGVELPRCAAAVQFAHHQRRLHGEIFAKVVAQFFRADAIVLAGTARQTHIGVRHLTEVLSALLRLVDGHGDGDAFHIRGGLS